MIESNVEVSGYVNVLIEDKSDGSIKTKYLSFNNAVLRGGRAVLVRSLTNNYGDAYEYFITNMIFGDGGVESGTVRFVPTQRTALFGTTRATKPVISEINPNNPSQGIFTSVLTYDDAVGYDINEMALVMANGTLYSMATFGSLAKTSSMQITFNWNLNFV